MSKVEGEKTFPYLWALSSQRTGLPSNAHTISRVSSKERLSQTVSHLNGSPTSKSTVKTETAKMAPSQWNLKQFRKTVTDSPSSLNMKKPIPLWSHSLLLEASRALQESQAEGLSFSCKETDRAGAPALLPVQACGSLPLIPIWESRPRLSQQLWERGGAAWVWLAPEHSKLSMLPNQGTTQGETTHTLVSNLSVTSVRPPTLLLT